MKRHTVSVFPATVLLAVLLTACGGDSSSPPTPTQGAAAAQPSPTQPVAASATLAAEATTASPQATPTTPPAPTATEAPEGFQIEGSAEFVAWTEQALELLRTDAPEWYEQVEASIRTFRSVSAGSGMDVFNKVYLVGEITAYAPGFAPPEQLIWYAATMVHDSCHSERYDEGLVYQGKEGELACLTDQKAALLMIETNPYFSNYVQSLIDGADNPANAYWNTPNRHW